MLIGSAVQAAGGEALPPPVDVTTWSLESWRAWPLDPEVLSTREAPLAAAGVNDWLRTGDSWVGERDAHVPQASVQALMAGALSVTEFYLTGGGNEKGPNRVFCATAVPQGVAGPFPVLFVFHGGGGHASGALAVAIARNNPGFVAVAVDYNGQFRPAATPVTRWVTLTESVRERRHDLAPNPLNFPMYHNVQATRRVLDWVEDQPWADPARIGAVGISYGGWLSFILAGVDTRIRSVLTGVSAGGAQVTRGRSNQAQDWTPAEQYELWTKHAAPLAYAARTRVPVFMKLATNDRFFWLSGAALHRERLAGEVNWLLTPNSDHGKGGPQLPDPSGRWHRAVFLGDAAFPRIEDVAFADGGCVARVRVRSERPVRSVHLAWSPGAAVSPARYWSWLEAEEESGAWQARLPENHDGLTGLVYATVVDADGRALSSPLFERPGSALTETMTWNRGALWDVARGPEAWRPDLSFGGVTIASAGPGRIRVLPAAPDARVAVLTNSFMVRENARREQAGIRIELGGNGARFHVRVIMARDSTSLDEQRYAADVPVDEESAVIDLAWDRFAPYGRGTTEAHILPANALVIQCDQLPETGLTIGPTHWLTQP